MHSSIILSEVLGIKNSSATSSAFQTTTDLKFGFGKILFFIILIRKHALKIEQ